MKTDFATAENVGLDQIPIIDISALLDGGAVENVAMQIIEAASEIGFFYIKGHCIDRSLMKNAFHASKTFFDLPEADKASIAVNTDQRGWMATGMSRLQGSKTFDLKEVFFWGAEIADDHPDLIEGKALVAKNQWPNEVFPRLRTDLLPYYDAVCAVAQMVLGAIAVGLDRPHDFFDPFYKTPLARGQLVYYPESSISDESEERFGVAPHSDFGILTFLLQDDNSGLQVKHKSGTWIEAPPVANTLVCNIGDLLQRWSNDRLVSTIHRVINRSGNKRYSIPVFYDPSSESIIDPVDFGMAKAQSNYEPIATGEYIMGRNKKSFSQFKK